MNERLQNITYQLSLLVEWCHAQVWDVVNPKFCTIISIVHALQEYHRTTIKAKIFILMQEYKCPWVEFEEVLIIKFIHHIPIGAI